LIEREGEIAGRGSVVHQEHGHHRVPGITPTQRLVPKLCRERVQ
jgi:hypothetical protein